MQRRTFVTLAGGAVLERSLPAADSKNAYIELRRYQLRNTQDGMPQRTTDYFSHSLLPALQRAGAGTIGVFGSLVAPDGPFLLLLTSYPGLAAWESSRSKLGADAGLRKELEALFAGGLGWLNVQADLFRAFDSAPKVEVPELDAKRAPRVFELRTYRSNNPVTLGRKVRMFNGGEIGIFRRLGMKPVFFGTALTGQDLPNLTYMLAYDSLSHREKVWADFGSDAEWQKLRATPGLADGEIVSNISNILLRPLPFSTIR